MNQTIHPTSRFACVAFVFATLLPATLAQPIPNATPPPSSSAPGPGGVGPVMPPASINTPMLTPMLPSSISDDEFKKYSSFQQQANEDPAIKEINAKITKLTQEIQQLRAEANATREKLIAANPEMKKIQEKIMSAMKTRSNNGPMPLPVPAPSKTNSGPMPQPAPTSNKAP